MIHAPELKTPQLDLHRVRCSCQIENLVVFAKPWYKFQATSAVELPCSACNKSLLPMQVPVGSHHRAFTPETLPTGLAAAISPELGAEVAEAQDTPVDEIPLDSASWSTPHEPSPEYLDWLATLPAPVPIDRTRMIQNAAATGILALLVLLTLLF